jgi:hypothetical protein
MPTKKKKGEKAQFLANLMQKNKIEKKRVKSNRARMSNLQPKT